MARPDMIGYDSYFQHERAQVYVPMNTPENKREIPCDTCKFSQVCEENVAECSAFRTWAASGDYIDSDVARHVRLAK